MLPSGLATASAAIARAPLPPWMFSTTMVLCMMRERCGAIVRRNTSLPPPGLEWVTRVTTEPPPSAGLIAPHEADSRPRERTTETVKLFDICSGCGASVSLAQARDAAKYKLPGPVASPYTAAVSPSTSERQVYDPSEKPGVDRCPGGRDGARRVVPRVVAPLPRDVRSRQGGDDHRNGLAVHLP